MKYLEVVFVLLMINLSAGLLVQTNILQMDGIYQVNSESPVDEYGNLYEKESLAYKINEFNRDREYLNNAQTLDQTYLQSGGDFVRAAFWFIETFVKGTILLPITLRNFGVPDPLVWFFSIPVMFLYVVAIVQLISGRTFGGTY